LELIWIEAGHLEEIDHNNDEHNHSQEEYKSAWEKLKSSDGVVVPGGFGNRYDL
jgi:CTP synthase (UTP-ammonia lyase)